MGAQREGKQAGNEGAAEGALLAKARLLVDRLGEVLARNDRLERKVRDQAAVIDDLSGRLRSAEESRRKARDILKRLANQLPGR